MCVLFGNLQWFLDLILQHSRCLADFSILGSMSSKHFRGNVEGRRGDYSCNSPLTDEIYLYHLRWLGHVLLMPFFVLLFLHFLRLLNKSGRSLRADYDLAYKGRIRLQWKLSVLLVGT